MLKYDIINKIKKIYRKTKLQMIGGDKGHLYNTI